MKRWWHIPLLLFVLLILTAVLPYGCGRALDLDASTRRHSTHSTKRHVLVHHPHRSRKARAAFEHSHPCPATGKNHGACKGYVVDHVTALAYGGADDPSNMQWQTIAAGKAKDKVELDCK